MEESAPRFHRYRPEILAALEAHGFRPTGAIEPGRVYELLKSLYVWELRRLKEDFRRLDPGFGRETRELFGAANRRLLDRYAVLRLPPHAWAEPREADSGEPSATS